MALAGSCTTNVREGYPAIGDGEHLVTLSFTVPGSPATRAMDEEAVETIDVLLFDPSTDNIVYRAIGTKPVSNQFTVKLPANTYNIVLLANARDMIPAAYPPATTDASFTNDTRQDVLAAITKSIAPVGGNWWPATFDRIPMWGYSNGFVVGTSSPTINLTRMIAKIDITVDDKVTDFWLRNVRLYNYSTAGHVAPAALPPTAPADSRYAGYDITQWNNIPAGIKAYAPHLSTGVKATDDYIIYIADLSNTKDIVEYKDNIYAFESAAGVTYPAAGWKQNTCLVIGGYYQSTAYPTYYRVEFKNAVDALLPLLRNHRYTVTITGVSANGYPTPEEAYNNLPSNITVQITAWNEGGLDDITFDPQHHLAVDENTLSFYTGGGQRTMEAVTDFPAGWKIEKDAAYDWFTVTPATHASTSQQTITVTIPGVGGPREGHFYIVAGNLRKMITVTQSELEEFMIQITDLEGHPVNELTFGAGDYSGGVLPAAKQFRVTWLPVDADCVMTLDPVPGMPLLVFGGDMSPLTGGSAFFTIQPYAMAPEAVNHLSSLKFTATRGDQSRAAVIYLGQINNYLIATPSLSGYVADADITHSFLVRSNFAWRAVLDGGGADRDDLINSWSHTGGPSPEGELFEFTLNEIGFPAEATFSFKLREGQTTVGSATINGAPPRVTLSKTAYSVSDAGTFNREISMSTNIPVELLTATITGPGALVGASCVGGPLLRLSFNNTLTGLTFQDYVVEVEYDNQVMATLTVHLASPDWQEIDGKLVRKA
ncbi:MAG: FimB/Mfa2 family fimbrial subunit, partial [Odoribacteraceae bacterium]|nr:FimB/Mfa2 family fimbrial subunit [Odoribacteraceae bacterium]